MRSASAVSSQIRRFLSRPLNRVQHDFRSGLKMELFLNAVAERIDGGYGDVEVLGDLSRAFAMAQHSKDFEFTIAQGLEGRSGFIRLAAHEFRNHRRGHPLAQ